MPITNDEELTTIEDLAMLQCLDYKALGRLESKAPLYKENPYAVCGCGRSNLYEGKVKWILSGNLNQSSVSSDQQPPNDGEDGPDEILRYISTSWHQEMRAHHLLVWTGNPASG